MPIISKGDKILVSGANGYIPIWIVRILLERGYAVRGTVRGTSKGEYLKNYFTTLGYGDKFEYVIVEDIAKVRSVMRMQISNIDQSPGGRVR